MSSLILQEGDGEKARLQVRNVSHSLWCRHIPAHPHLEAGDSSRSHDFLAALNCKAQKLAGANLSFPALDHFCLLYRRSASTFLLL